MLLRDCLVSMHIEIKQQNGIQRKFIKSLITLHVQFILEGAKKKNDGCASLARLHVIRMHPRRHDHISSHLPCLIFLNPLPPAHRYYNSDDPDTMASLFSKMGLGRKRESGAGGGGTEVSQRDSPFDAMREGEASLMSACEKGEREDNAF